MLKPGLRAIRVGVGNQLVGLLDVSQLGGVVDGLDGGTRLAREAVEHALVDNVGDVDVVVAALLGLDHVVLLLLGHPRAGVVLGRLDEAHALGRSNRLGHSRERELGARRQGGNGHLERHDDGWLG